jgi:hypothetical protein
VSIGLHRGVSFPLLGCSPSQAPPGLGPSLGMGTQDSTQPACPVPSAQMQGHGRRVKEGAHINRSLLTLGSCINAPSERGEGGRASVNFRDSKLTRLLKVGAVAAGRSPAGRGPGLRTGGLARATGGRAMSARVPWPSEHGLGLHAMVTGSSPPSPGWQPHVKNSLFPFLWQYCSLVLGPLAFFSLCAAEASAGPLTC